MKKTKEETARSRERILTSASRRFREGGFAGVSVKDLMSEAGLTHGAFYAHFPSKDALIGAACAEAFRETSNRLVPRADSTPDETLTHFLDRYLSRAHLETPARGCAITALAPEAAREPGEVKAAFTDGIATMIDRLAELVPGDDSTARHERAITLLAEAVGSMVLARAVESDALQDAILGAARRHLLPPTP